MFKGKKYRKVINRRLAELEIDRKIVKEIMEQKLHLYDTIDESLINTYNTINEKIVLLNMIEEEAQR